MNRVEHYHSLINFWKETIKKDNPCFIHDEDNAVLKSYFGGKRESKKYLLNKEVLG